MEENYGFGYRSFDSFARFVDRHTPNPIRNMAKKFNNKPIEKMKYLTYGGLTLTGGISVYGFWEVIVCKRGQNVICHINYLFGASVVCS